VDSCSFGTRFVEAADQTFRYSTVDNSQPRDRIVCQLEAYPATTSTICHAAGRTVTFGSEPGCIFLPDATIPCDYIVEASPAAISVCCLVGIAVLLKLYLLAQLWRRRAETAIVRLQPALSAIALGGGIVLDLTPLWLLGSHHQAACMLRPAWASLGFCLLFGSLSLKAYRILTLFGVHLAASDASAAEAEVDKLTASGKARLTTSTMLRYLGLLLLCNLAVWTALWRASSWAPREYERVYLVTMEVDQSLPTSGSGSPSRAWITVGPDAFHARDTVCPSADEAAMVVVLLNAGLLCCTLWIAWRTKAVFVEFNESERISLCCLVAIVTVAILLLLPAKLNPVERFVTKSVGIIIASTLICVARVPSARTESPKDADGSPEDV